MNPTTEIAFVLDRSGSMSAIRDTAIQTFNQFLSEQRTVGDDARFTLVLFDHETRVPFAAVPIAEVGELDRETFVPCGNTALLDAMGCTIDVFGERLAAMPPDSRPKQVIVAVMTDGYENASRRFSRADIAEKIRQQKEVYNWQFFFLGADQDAIAHAAGFNIGAANTLSFEGTDDGYRVALFAMSRKSTALRKISAKRPLTVQESSDLDADLSSLAESGKAKV